VKLADHGIAFLSAFKALQLDQFLRHISLADTANGGASKAEE
jgi:hypothetical protein